MELLARIEAHVRRHDLIAPGGEVLCLVSGGADSTCMWHALGELGYAVSALHVNHGLRGEESQADADFCRTVLDADVVTASEAGTTESQLRDVRYSFATGRLRATAHTADDQLETVLYRLVSSGAPGGIKPRREDGVVRPLLTVRREETAAYCRAAGLPFRVDSSNPGTKRGLIRERILPLLRELDPRAEASLLALADEPRRLPRGLEAALVELLSSREGSQSADLPGGIRAVREYGSLRLEGAVRWGPWLIESDVEGLEVRARLPGDRLAGRSKKLQDLFVDAKVPRAQRDDWPVVVRGDEVVYVPGVAAAPDYEHAVRARMEP